MIEVLFFELGDGFSGFKVQGHAGYARVGTDIVCASVSSLTIFTANLLIQMGVEIKRNDSQEGLIIDVQETSETTQIVIRALYTSLIDIAGQYPKNLRVEVKPYGNPNEYSAICRKKSKRCGKKRTG